MFLVRKQPLVKELLRRRLVIFRSAEVSTRHAHGRMRWDTRDNRPSSSARLSLAPASARLKLKQNCFPKNAPEDTNF